MLEIIKYNIDGPLLLKPRVFNDDRGYFMESYQKLRYEENGIPSNFIQDNESKSAKFVLRGLHFQKPPYAQAKLIRVISGAIFDVVVDIRKSSPSYGKYISAILSDQNKHQLFVPEGFAHGFLVLEDNTIVNYKVNAFYNRESEGTLQWNDADLNIDWPTHDVSISEKDVQVSKDFKTFVSPFE